MKNRHTSIVVFLALLALPLVASAAEKYVPLAQIPGLTDRVGEAPSLVAYLNAIFFLTISVAALIAVVRIVVAGFKYMMTDAWGGKEEAVSTIKAVVIGLIVLLLTVVILRTINPNLLNLNILQTAMQSPGTMVAESIRAVGNKTL